MLAGYSSGNLLALEESVIDWFLETALCRSIRNWAGNPLDRSGSPRLGREERIAGVEVVAGQTQIVYHRQTGIRPARASRLSTKVLSRGKPPTPSGARKSGRRGQMDFLSVAILRKAGEGILVLHADQTDIYHLRRRVVLQGMIDEWAGKGDILYLRFQGKDGEVWAAFDSREGRKRRREEPDRRRGGPSGPSGNHPEPDREGGLGNDPGRVPWMRTVKAFFSWG